MAPSRVATSCSQFVYIFISRVRKTSVSCGTKFCVFCVLSFHCVRVSFHLGFHRSWVIILVSGGERRRAGYVKRRNDDDEFMSLRHKHGENASKGMETGEC